MGTRRTSKLLRFIKFALIWYSQQFAIPFWIVGHVHLHFASYHAAFEAGASLFMHLSVAVGFYLDWRSSQANSEE